MRVPRSISDVALRASCFRQLKSLERKLADLSNYCEHPAEKELDGAEIEFLRMRIEALDLSIRLKTNPPPHPEEAAVMRKRLKDWVLEHMTAWDYLCGLDRAAQREARILETRQKKRTEKQAKLRAAAKLIFNARRQREQRIYQIIEMGVRGLDYCREMDQRGIKGRPRWGNFHGYVKDYPNPEWQKKIQQEKWKIAHDMRKNAPFTLRTFL